MHDRAINRARAMRDKAVSIAMQRKEEFLGARVPKDLRDKVIQKASDLGIPVSILIRNILEEAFNNSQEQGLVRVATRQAGSESWQGIKQPAECFSSVLGWEDIRLNKAMDCFSCGKPLLPGASVTLGLAQPGTAHIILCDQCKGLT